jgi:hypothetical protein
MMAEMKMSQDEATAAQANPEHDKFQKMLQWLIDGGAKFPKLYLQYYDEDYRGVHCSTRIPFDEVILEVPLSHIMTRYCAGGVAAACQAV